MNNVLDDHRLRYLFEAIRLGSVRAAADAMGVNPSVVSRQIAQLEKDLDLRLIERLGRGVRPTEAGALLVDRFRRWSAEREDTLAKLREIQGLQRGHLDIILGEGFVSDLLSGPLLAFWRRYPRLTMALHVGGTDEVIRAVVDDRSHMGLVYHAPADPRLRVNASIRQPICLIARPDHPLVLAGRPPRLAEITGYPLGLMHPSYGVRQIVSLAEAADKVGLSPQLTTGSMYVLREFAKANMGVTLLPAFAVGGDLANGDLVAVPVDSPLLMSGEAQLITRAGRELPAAASQLLRYLGARMRAFRIAAS